jgi:hypothetical protein
MEERVFILNKECFVRTRTKAGGSHNMRLPSIFSTNPTCSLWFPITSHAGKDFANFKPLFYIYKLSKKAATFKNTLG